MHALQLWRGKGAQGVAVVVWDLQPYSRLWLLLRKDWQEGMVCCCLSCLWQQTWGTPSKEGSRNAQMDSHSAFHSLPSSAKLFPCKITELAPQSHLDEYKLSKVSRSPWNNSKKIPAYLEKLFLERNAQTLVWIQSHKVNRETLIREGFGSDWPTDGYDQNNGLLQ